MERSKVQSFSAAPSTSDDPMGIELTIGGTMTLTSKKGLTFTKAAEQLPFTAEPDGVTLYLSISPSPPPGWRGELENHIVWFTEIGRVLERIGLHESQVLFDLPDPGGEWLSLRFDTSANAAAFRMAANLPFQTAVR